MNRPGVFCCPGCGAESPVERLLDRHAAAAMVGCHPNNLDALEREGTIPERRRLSGGRVAWLYSEMVIALRSLPKGGLKDRTAAARLGRQKHREAAKAGVTPEQ